MESDGSTIFYPMTNNGDQGRGEGEGEGGILSRRSSPIQITLILTLVVTSIRLGGVGLKVLWTSVYIELRLCVIKYK